MSTILNTMMFRRGTVRHLATRRISPIRTNDNFVTFCGIDTIRRQYVNVDGDRNAYGYALCKTCQRVRDITDMDIVAPEPNDITTARARDEAATIREIPGFIFRVVGKTDTYTVTVPENAGLAGLCNCMAGKTRPHIECKHLAAVRIKLESRETRHEHSSNQRTD